jgi:hypothetical protein
MKRRIFFAAAALSLAMGHPAIAQKGRAVTCVGILIEVDVNPRADFPMAVVYDNCDDLNPHTCVLNLGHAGHWLLRGAPWRVKALAYIQANYCSGLAISRPYWGVNRRLSWDISDFGEGSLFSPA